MSSPTIDPSIVQQFEAFHSEMESLKAQEDTCVLLPTFDGDIAFALGAIIRTQCQRSYTRPGTHPDDMHWVKRKEGVVLQWGMSTTRMRAQMERSTSRYTPAQEALKTWHEITDSSVYACHGGGFPVRVKNVDHGVIVNGIQEYLANIDD
ncbi:hypothetical protein EV363DRAFT_1402074 [Boletus edulis]|uniref:Uncharacterized protein n=1 Tax=Boletus edulis BED1 TaxID=1328754 RepID=A0AAD4C3F0_BOLED|nr:hypothetical protein EV363DRAFT_1402074 [Boletus edulis]KAF8447248.1 hypothetical protein L210DRAFT_3500987 [Boletus edulis BED1]